MKIRRNIVLQIALIAGSLTVVVIGAHFVFDSRAASAPLLGPDTSNNQPILDSATAKSKGMTFHFMKVTQGLNFNDSKFASQRAKSVAAGLIVGGYHFLEKGNGAAQCDHYINQLKANGGINDIMLAVDVELQNSTTGPSYADLKNFLAECQPKTPGRTWVVYTAPWYWGNSKQAGYLGNPKAPAGTVLWVAIYVGGNGTFKQLLASVGAQGDSDDPYAAAPMNGWSSYAFRQYSSSAKLANIDGIDANVTYKGLDFVKQLAGIATAKPDLVITKVSWSPTVPTTGSKMTFSATIKNQGKAATPSGSNIGISFLVDGKQVSWSSNGNTPLATGASRTQTANGGSDGNATWTATTGSHTVQAYVDDLDLIDESSESNNTLNSSLAIGTKNKPGDVNGDGRVNAIDMSVLLSKDGQNYPPADFNDDGTVGAADMAIMLSKWTW